LSARHFDPLLARARGAAPQPEREGIPPPSVDGR
jgi:hypothetical protein